MSSPIPSYASEIRKGHRTSDRIPHGSGGDTGGARKRKIPAILLFIVGFGCILSWQGSRQVHPLDYYQPGSGSSYSHFDLPSIVSSYAGGGSSMTNGPLGIPEGEATALPNLKIIDLAVEAKRKKSRYGGSGDSPHLGGFLSGKDIDMQAISPLVWKNMVTKYNIKSVLDLGCGRGFSTLWFYTHGVRTRGVDGSSDAIRQSSIPPEKRGELLVEHDFALGPW